jgi:hypothetical protein
MNDGTALMPSTLQLALARYLRALADWRRQRAEEYDRDARNLQSAAGLEELAEFVLALLEDDPRLAELQRLALSGDELTPGQQAHFAAARFRFFEPDVSCDAFLTRLVELQQADSTEHGRFGGRMPEGDDPWATRSGPVY